MATGIWAVCGTLFKRRGSCRYFRKKEKDSLSLPSSRTAALTELSKRNLKIQYGISQRAACWSGTHSSMGPQHLKGHGIIYAIITFFLVLTLINQILNNTLQSLSVFLSRMNQERRCMQGPRASLTSVLPSVRCWAEVTLIHRNPPHYPQNKLILEPGVSQPGGLLSAYSSGWALKAPKIYHSTQFAAEDNAAGGKYPPKFPSARGQRLQGEGLQPPCSAPPKPVASEQHQPFRATVARDRVTLPGRVEAG